MEILIFGTGKLYRYYMQMPLRAKINALLDNDAAKQGMQIDGIPVFSPEEGIKIPHDYIYIFARQENEIREQLHELGVPDGKICGQHDFARIIAFGETKKYTAYESDHINCQKAKILLMTHGMAFSGAPMALFEMGNLLVHNGYMVTVAADCHHGFLQNCFLSHWLNVIVEPNLVFGKLEDFAWVQEFNFVVINTVCLYYLLKRRDTKIPVLWWLHDADEYYSGIEGNELRQIALQENLEICAVSDIAKRYFCKRAGNVPVSIMPYGLRDFFTGNEQSTSKCVFALIGDVIPRKGTDIFLDAIEILLRANYHDVAFWIIGNDNAEFAATIKERAKDLKDLKIWGTMPHEALEKLYPQITAVVVPSRDDILPIVAVEAMMNYKGCIISENNDIAHYVHENNAGFVCSVHDANVWAALMKWVINHRDEWREMGKRGREIYEKVFSMDVFKKNVLKVVSGSLKNGATQWKKN